MALLVLTVVLGCAATAARAARGSPARVVPRGFVAVDVDALGERTLFVLGRPAAVASAVRRSCCAAAAVLVLLALDVHLVREGKDNHALALLEAAQWLHARLAQLLEVWRTVER